MGNESSKPEQGYDEEVGLRDRLRGWRNKLLGRNEPPTAVRLTKLRQSHPECYIARTNDVLPKLSNLRVIKAPVSRDWALQKKRTLGTGFSGAVVLAENRDTGQRAAVKGFSKAKLGDQRRLDMLRDEINVYLSLDHPNVCKLLYAYEDRHHVWLVMELCAEELYDRLCTVGVYTELEASEALSQMFLAVNYLHSYNIVHRDLKLENWISCSPQTHQRLKLIDFGFSKKLRRADDILELPCGTLHYASPDVLRRSYTSKCDLWSMGVICFMLLTGSPPFTGSSNQSVIERIRAGRIRFNSRWAKLSKTAQHFTLALLDADAERRLSGRKALQHDFLRRQFHRYSIRHFVELQPRTAAVCSSSSGSSSGKNKINLVENMRNFANGSRLMRAGLLMLAYRLSSEDTAELMELFFLMDRMVGPDGTDLMPFSSKRCVPVPCSDAENEISMEQSAESSAVGGLSRLTSPAEGSGCASRLTSPVDDVYPPAGSDDVYPPREGSRELEFSASGGDAGECSSSGAFAAPQNSSKPSRGSDSVVRRMARLSASEEENADPRRRTTAWEGLQRVSSFARVTHNRASCAAGADEEAAAANEQARELRRGTTFQIQTNDFSQGNKLATTTSSCAAGSTGVGTPSTDATETASHSSNSSGPVTPVEEQEFNTSTELVSRLSSLVKRISSTALNTQAEKAERTLPSASVVGGEDTEYQQALLSKLSPSATGLCLSATHSSDAVQAGSSSSSSSASDGSASPSSAHHAVAGASEYRSSPLSESRGTRSTSPAALTPDDQESTGTSSPGGAGGKKSGSGSSSSSRRNNPYRRYKKVAALIRGGGGGENKRDEMSKVLETCMLPRLRSGSVPARGAGLVTVPTRRSVCELVKADQLQDDEVQDDEDHRLGA
eukprot:g7993.t1